MNVAILGTERPSQIVAQLIEQNYNSWLEQRLGEKLNVVAFVTGGGAAPPNIGNVAVLNQLQFVALYHRKVIDKIIFPREIFFETQKGMLTNLRILNFDINDVYIAARLSNNLNVLNFLEPYPGVRYLPHIEFRIAEQCNLNCKMCTEYCALVKEPRFMSLEKFAQDFAQLHKFIDDFAAIRILGGEPLLNPQVGEFVKICRKLYPVSPLHVVTNAILLPKMPDEFFDTVRENEAIICISFYRQCKAKCRKSKGSLRKSR